MPPSLPPHHLGVVCVAIVIFPRALRQVPYNLHLALYVRLAVVQTCCCVEWAEAQELVVGGRKEGREGTLDLYVGANRQLYPETRTRM